MGVWNAGFTPDGLWLKVRALHEMGQSPAETPGQKDEVADAPINSADIDFGKRLWSISSIAGKCPVGIAAASRAG